MELLLLDETFTVVKVLDSFESLLWTERYYACGDFELYAPVSSELFALMEEDYYLWLKEDNRIMIIESKQIETDVEDGSKLIVTGRSLESILERRVIWNHTVLSGSFQNAIKKLLYDNLIAPSDSNRKIANFIFEPSIDIAITNLTIDAQFHGENLYETIQSLCETNKVGFRVYLNENNMFVFQLYSGNDRSYDQSKNPYVIFSPKFDNLVNSNYLESRKTLKTDALVGGEGEGAERKTTSVAARTGSKAGLERRELFVEAGGVSTNVDGEEISEAEYIAQLAQKGKEELTMNVETKVFEGECETSKLFVFGEDFFMGDIVQLTNEYAIEARTRVVELVRSQDINGIDVHPTFETVYEEGYTPLEYVETSGSIHVETFVPATDKTRVIFSCEHVDVVEGSYFGARTSTSSSDRYGVLANASLTLRDDYGNESIETGLVPPDQIVIDKNRGTTTINGTVFTHTEQGMFTGLDIVLFGYNTGGDNGASSKTPRIKFKSCVMLVDDVIVRDYIPAIDKYGVAALYDRVSGEFFYGIGSGSLIAGPVIYRDSNTLFLLHGDSIQNASKYGIDVTNNGVAVSSAVTKFAKNTLYFNGSSYISFIMNNFMTSDFTIDWWEYATSESSGSRFCSSCTGANEGYGGLLLGYKGAGVYASTQFNAKNSWNIVNGEPMLDNTINTWIHWAFVKSENTVTTYKNGRIFATTTAKGEIGYCIDSPMVIGEYRKGDSNPFIGYITEFRISDCARWIGDFTPPTAPYDNS